MQYYQIFIFALYKILISQNHKFDFWFLSLLMWYEFYNKKMHLKQIESFPFLSLLLFFLQTFIILLDKDKVTTEEADLVADIAIHCHVIKVVLHFNNCRSAMWSWKLNSSGWSAVVCPFRWLRRNILILKIL